MTDQERKHIIIVGDGEALKIATALMAMGEHQLAERFSNPEGFKVFVSSYQNRHGTSMAAFLDLADVEADRQNIAIENYHRAFDGPPPEDRQTAADLYFEQMGDDSKGDYYEFEEVRVQTFVEAKPAPVLSPDAEGPKF